MATSDTEVFEAALRGDCDTLRRLLPSQASRTTPEGYAPLGLTVSAGHVESARLLLAHGAAVDQQDAAGVSALMHACMHGYAELCNLLLLHGAKPLLRNREALCCVRMLGQLMHNFPNIILALRPPKRKSVEGSPEGEGGGAKPAARARA